MRRIVCSFALLLLAGCTTTNSIRPSEVGRLDGYDVRAVPFTEPELQTIDGAQVRMGADSRLYLDLPEGRVGGRFATIEVHDGYFAGRTDDAQVIQTPVDRISAAQLERPNNAATVGWGAGGVLAAGLLVLLVYGFFKIQTQTVEGRPLRVRGKIVSAPAADGEGWSASGVEPDLSSLSPAGRMALADSWTETARFEHASIPAFSRLSLTLVSLGAPARLVEGAHRAALEEIEHARLAFALAGAYAGERVAPGALPELRKSPAVTAGSLAELAYESLIDGCLNEGFSAAVAAAASERTRDPAARAAWAALARDEASHAGLAWEILQWCLDRGEPDLGRRLRKAVHTTPPSVDARELPASLWPELEAHGWLRPAERQDLFHDTRLAIASRLAALTAQRAPAA